MERSNISGPLLVEEPAVLDAIYKFRARVWAAEGGIVNQDPSTEYRDVFDETAMHWAAWIGDELVGSARLTVHESFAESPDYVKYGSHEIATTGRISFFGRLVIAPIVRGTGLSKRFDEVRVRAANNAGVGSVFLYALEDRANSLARNGFRVCSCFKAEVPFVGLVNVYLLNKTL